MPRLTRIYTRGGDGGHTHLADGGRIPKTSARLAALGDVNETSAALGLARSLLAAAAPSRSDPPADAAPAPTAASAPPAATHLDHPSPPDAAPISAAGWIEAVLLRLEAELFDIGADLAAPLAQPDVLGIRRIDATWTARLERDADAALAQLVPLPTFVLPGGPPPAAALHLATAVARRAERSVWVLAEADGLDRPGGVNAEVARYLNRLGDLLFCLARLATPPGAETLWQPPDAPLPGDRMVRRPAPKAQRPPDPLPPAVA
jgi:cob(I)alamin adenosyltransferase